MASHEYAPRPAGKLGTTSFTAMTYNLWGEHFLDERLEPLRALLETRPPDLLTTQELVPRTMALLDDALPHHERVDDPFPGWSTRSNIWWRADMFELVEHGTADIGLLTENGRLFWTRLRSRTANQEILLATSHLTFQRHPAELADLKNRRVPQARATVAELARLSPEGTVIFTADLNDVAPSQLELGLAGYLDCFTALGRSMPATHPIPAAASLEGIWSPTSPLAGIAKGIDVIFARGAVAARTAEVVDFYHRGRVASDHMPVVATYTFVEPA